MSDTKACPYCGESILAVAIKCKHCGSNLNSNDIGEGSNSSGAVSLEPASTMVVATDYSLALLAVPVIATLLIWFWINGMPLIFDPGSKLTLITILTIATTSLIASMEASKLGMVSNKEKGSYSPIQWFFLLTFLWVLYPVYFSKRKAYGKSGNSGFAWTILILFIGSVYIAQSAINENIANVRAALNSIGAAQEPTKKTAIQSPRDAQKILDEISIESHKMDVLVCWMDRGTFEGCSSGTNGIRSIEETRNFFDKVSYLETSNGTITIHTARGEKVVIVPKPVEGGVQWQVGY